jgi:hypothetical protein
MSPTLFKLVVLSIFAILMSAGFAPTPKWKPKEFPISFWCGPPEKLASPERFKETAEAGFNYTFPACEGPFTLKGNRRILDGAQSAGIKAFIFDNRIPLSITGVPDAKDRLDAIVNEYSKHPALAGYFVVDEPAVDKFAGLAEVVEYLRKKDPNHPAYINLWPNNAGPKRMGIDSYEEYIKRFVAEVKPAFLSYDHYHWLKEGDRPGFTSNLLTVSSLASKNNLHFWQIILSLKHMEYRQPSEAEMRYDAMQTLAFGGKGLMYFTYWTPPGMDFFEGEGFIDRNGKTTARYEEVKRINTDVRLIGKYLLYAILDNTFQTGEIEAGVGISKPETLIAVERGDVTVGIFHSSARSYALVASRVYTGPSEVSLVVSSSGRPIRRLKKPTGTWERVVSEHRTTKDELLRITLASGDAELFQW